MDLRIIWLALGTFAVGVEGFVIGGTLPLIAADLGMTVAQAGILAVLYSFAAALFAPVLAALFGGHDQRSVLLLAAAGFVAGEVLMATAPGLPILLVARVIIAASAGLYVATAQATAVGLAPAEQRGRAISIVIFGTTAAVAFGAPLGALIGGTLGWRATYIAIAAAGVVAAIAIAIMVPGGIRGERTTLRERLAVVGAPGVLRALFAVILYVAGAFAVVTYIAPVTTDAMGFSLTLIPAVLLAYGLGAAAGNIIGGQLSDRVGAREAVMVSMGARFVLAMLLPVVAILPDGARLPAFFAFSAAWGLAGWSYLPGQASRLAALAPRAVPLALALNSASLSLGTATGALIGARVIEIWGAVNLAWPAAALSGVALLLVAFERARSAKAS